MSTFLKLTATPNTSIIPYSAHPRHLYLLLEVSGGEHEPALPMNLGLVIDCSNSMRIRLVTEEQFKQLAREGLAREVMTDGVPAWQIDEVPTQVVSQLLRRIDYVQQALANADRFLRPVDHFSVTAFAGKAVNLIPSTNGEAKERLHQAASQLENLELGDETSMPEGIAMALSEIQRVQNGALASHLILLTDGHTRNVQECYALAQQARTSGITFSTMGIGTEFNEELLIPLADMTGGNAYYIEKPDQILAAFQVDLSAARSIRYLNLEIKLRLPKSVQLASIFKVLPELSKFEPGPNLDGSYSLSLGNYDPAVPPALLLELLIPPWPEGSFRLAQLLLAWDNPRKGLGKQNDRQEVMVQVSNRDNHPLNQHVMNIVEKVSAFRLGIQALEEAHSGQLPQASQRLRQAATRLLDMGEKSLGNEMILQANRLDSQGQIDPNATKKLRYETRHLTKHLEEQASSRQA